MNVTSEAHVGRSSFGAAAWLSELSVLLAMAGEASYLFLSVALGFPCLQTGAGGWSCAGTGWGG